MTNAWDRSEGETDRAFEAFAVYRDQPTGHRSARLVAQELSKSAGIIARWSTEWNWVARVERWDRHVDEMDQERQAAAELEKKQEMRELRQEGYEALGRAALDEIKKRGPAFFEKASTRDIAYAAELAFKGLRTEHGDDVEASSIDLLNAIEANWDKRAEDRAARNEEIVAVMRDQMGGGVQVEVDEPDEEDDDEEEEEDE